jgi:hypothetical protein
VPIFASKGLGVRVPLAPHRTAASKAALTRGNKTRAPPEHGSRRGFRRCLSQNLSQTASDGNREHAVEHGETILAIFGGAIAVVIGVALRRYRHEFHRLTVEDHRRMYGDKVAQKVADSSGHGHVALFGAIFIAFGVLLIVLSPWVSNF